MKRIATFLISFLLVATMFAQVKLHTKYLSLAGSATSININLASDGQMFHLSGTRTLSAPYSVSVTGSPVDGQTILMFYDGTALTTGGNAVTIFGFPLTDKQATLKLGVLATYKTNIWETRVFVDAKSVNWIGKGDLGGAAFDGSTIELNGTNGVQLKDGGITNAKINASAAITKSKLALTHAIDSGDISLTAKIPFTKMLPLTANRVPYIGSDGFVTPSSTTSTELGYLAGVTSAVQTQINSKPTSGAIVNADINASAAVAYSKLILTGSLVNADLSSAAALAWSKMAALTANKIPYINSSGVVAATSVTDTELGYLSGLTANVQTQITAARSSRTVTSSSSATITLSSTATDSYLIKNTTGRITVTLPAATDFAANHVIEFTRLSAGSTDSIFIVAPSGTDLIGVTGANVSSYILPGNVPGGAGVGFIGNGTDNWRYLRRW